jgi:hypothetical protein
MAPFPHLPILRRAQPNVVDDHRHEREDDAQSCSRHQHRSRQRPDARVPPLGKVGEGGNPRVSGEAGQARRGLRREREEGLTIRVSGKAVQVRGDGSGRGEMWRWLQGLRQWRRARGKGTPSERGVKEEREIHPRASEGTGDCMWSAALRALFRSAGGDLRRERFRDQHLAHPAAHACLPSREGDMRHERSRDRHLRILLRIRCGCRSSPIDLPCACAPA